MLRFDLAGLVVNESAEFAFLFSGTAGENQNRDPLGERAGHRVDHVVTSSAVGHARHADLSGRPRVAVGGKPDPRLV
jgi:hypothetical protein